MHAAALLRNSRALTVHWVRRLSYVPAPPARCRPPHPPPPPQAIKRDQATQLPPSAGTHQLSMLLLDSSMTAPPQRKMVLGMSIDFCLPK